MERAYLDHNATTPMRAEVRATIDDVLSSAAGNPSSLHESGRRARHRLDEARERVATALGVHHDEIVFTSGGTESNNLALLGALERLPVADGLAVSAIEHSSVLGPARELERRGRRLSVVPVLPDGTIDLGAFERILDEHAPALVSVMAANNEIGTCQPLEEVRRVCAALPRSPLLHTDAVQALGRIPVPLREWGIDLASFSAHKLGGPAGVGVLFRRRGVELRPLCFGGEQELGLRPGTENVAGIVGAALAIELAVRERGEIAKRLAEFARSLWTELESSLSHVELLGLPIDHARRLPGTLSLLAPEHDGKVLVTRLDLEGLECSAGSACASGSLEPSHVLLALGRSEREARASLRLSFGRETTWTTVRQSVDILRRTLGAPNAKHARRTSS